MARFSFPALPAGPASRRNWYLEMLDHPDCHGDPTRIQEAYASHRESYASTQRERFQTLTENPVTADQALIFYLKLLKACESGNHIPPTRVLDDQDVNCFVIWTRPPPSILEVMQSIQRRIASLIGSDFYSIPPEHLHLSLIELSHRHSVSQLRSVADAIGVDRLQKILDLPSQAASKPRLVAPCLLFDKMGMALTFLPSALDKYTYHHLRSDMHTQALESGVGIDMCYTAPSAHVTLGRFVGNHFFERSGRKQFLVLVERINRELKSVSMGDRGSKLEWVVGRDIGLELQLGYVKFGRDREEADLLGKI